MNHLESGFINKQTDMEREGGGEREKDIEKERGRGRERNVGNMFLILCFGPVGAGLYGNQIPRGEESVSCLAELHLPGSHAKTHESHDKNNIPHLSDSLQGIPVKWRHFSASIPRPIETIWRIV